MTQPGPGFSKPVYKPSIALIPIESMCERSFVNYSRVAMARYSYEEIADLLRDTAFLSHLPPNELLDLARSGRQERIASDEAIYLKGKPGTSIHLLCEGRVKITSSGPSGNELLLDLVEAGQLFGEITAIDGGLRTVNAITTRPSQVVSFDRNSFFPVIHANPAAALALSKHLCERLRFAIGNVEEIALLDAPTRLWMRLRNLGRRYGSTPETENAPIQIRHGLSQQSLADSIGVTRVMVNRQLGIWREAGLIEDGRGYVHIPDPSALEAFVRQGRSAAQES